MDILITPAPTVNVPTYFGVPIPPSLDNLLMVLLVLVSFTAILYFGWEFARKWRQYREINKYLKEEDTE
jgi:hypothetical protein